VFAFFPSGDLEVEAPDSIQADHFEKMIGSRA
jgi:hypothetical protein